MVKGEKIFVAGGTGMVGSAFIRMIEHQNLEVKILAPTRKQLNFEDRNSVKSFFKKNKVDTVYIAAAMVGGIKANYTYPGQFIKSNVDITLNLIHESYEAGIKKIIYLGSSCIYPKETKQPISEDALLGGFLEPTNEAYAIAKIFGIKMCEAYHKEYNLDCRAIMPCNLFGINDNYHPQNSHVIPGLINKFHIAKIKNHKKVNVWGTGNPRREFLFSDDLALACLHIMRLSKNEFTNLVGPKKRHINVGYGSDISIRNLACKIAKITNFKGEINFDDTTPDGTFQKLLDNKLISSIGWKPKTDLDDGLILAYENFKLRLRELK